jgi:hypothetical protein
MMWFIRLVANQDGGCYIAISDGTCVGSGGSNKELIYFLAYAQSLENMNVDSQRLWQKALQQPEDFDDLNVKQGSNSILARAMSTDEADGVIPYFDQIREPLEVLGHGRCGTVSKIKWGKGYAAFKKEFVIQPESEDDRYFYDVYEYELKVLDNLRSLWGKYVPALLFHKPWATSPVIGLQSQDSSSG